MAEEAQSHHPPATLSRELSLFHLTMMGVGMMIGAGAVIGMGHSVAIAGPGGALLAFALDGLIALFTAMSYAEMSSAIPKAGSIYNFARIAFNRPAGFIAGWMSWFASSVAGTFYAVIFAEYSVDFFYKMGLLDWVPLSSFGQIRLVAVAVSFLFAFINYRGVSSTGSTASFLTLGQTATLGFIGLFGLGVFILDPQRLANFRPFIPHGLGGVFVCMGFEYIAFEGYEVIAEAGDEALEPRRNLPKAILYSVLIVTWTYVAVAFALIVGVKDVGKPAWEWLGSFGEKGFGEAMARLIPLGNLIAVLTVLFAATSALNATIFSATRASYALGRDRMLPAFFSRISAKRRTPSLALLATAVLVTVCCFLPILDIASAASIMFLFMFLLANLSVIRLRSRMKEELQYGFMMPLFPWIPLLAVVLQAVLAVFIVNVSVVAWVVAPTWIALGFLVFYTYSQSRALPIREEILAVEAAPLPPREGMRILLPVTDTDQTLAMIPSVMRLVESRQASVELLHLVSVPDPVPLSDAGRLALPGQEAIMEASLYLAARTSVGNSILYCRNAARGILWGARTRHSDLILLGWRGRRNRIRLAGQSGGYVFGRTVDPVLESSPCDAVVFKNCGRPPFRQVLVPVSGGPNSRLALEMAAWMADPREGRVRALYVLKPGGRLFDLDAALMETSTRSELPAERFELAVKISSDPLSVILQEAGGADLVVLGASKTGFWNRVLKVSFPEEVARRCDKPLIMVKARRRLRLRRES